MFFFFIWYENGNGWIPIKHDTFLMKLTWNRNDWISVNMTRLWLDLMWKRHRLNFHMTDIVDGFALKNGNGWIFNTMTMLWLDLTWKTKMAEFLLDMTNVFYWWTWHENKFYDEAEVKQDGKSKRKYVNLLVCLESSE